MDQLANALENTIICDKKTNLKRAKQKMQKQLGAAKKKIKILKDFDLDLEKKLESLSK